jgi:hypothetical protein
MNRSLRHAAAFKLSLLASLGIAPVACGGTTSDGPDEAGGGSDNVSGNGGSTSQAGSTGKAGSKNQAGTTSQGGATGPGQTCTNPTRDRITQLVSCDEGFTHRPDAPNCATVIKIAAPEPQLPRADGTVPCADDPTKCNAYQNGYCDSSFGGGEAPVATCRSGCFSDFECGDNNICICGDSQSPTGAECRYSNCRVDAECAPGYFCASYSGLCGEGGFACQTPDDTCVSSEDCMNQSPCVFESFQGFRSCSNAVCGRPFLVEQHARLAPRASRSDWSAPQAPGVAHLSAAERAAQAEHWTKLGQMEHASIAAFARFSLQLLSLGAPADLVEACTQALADETAHTQLCFGIASAYAGRAVGPGPLDITGSLDVSSLEDIVDLVIAEGCFGETSAALDALEAAETASDPVIRAAYEQIAADEQRHAELAFRFVRWALTRDEGAVRARIQAAIAADAAPSAAVRLVVEPCLQALLTLAHAA